MTNPDFNPDKVAARILVDSNGEVEVEAVNIGQLSKAPYINLREFKATKSITKQVQLDIHKKNPTEVMRIYYIATDGTKKFKDIEIETP